MKINSSYYCIVDENNKPDYRYLFENSKDARKKIRQIKNSTRGETVLFNKRKKDYFVDGIKKDFFQSLPKTNHQKRLLDRTPCQTS